MSLRMCALGVLRNTIQIIYVRDVMIICYSDKFKYIEYERWH